MTLHSPSLAPDWRHPFLLERAVAQDIGIRLRDGASVVTPTTGSTCKVYKDSAKATLHVSGALTVGSTSLLSLAAVPASETLSNDWLAVFAILYGGLTYNFQNRVFLVGEIPRPRVSDEDIWGGDGVPELRHESRIPGGQTDYKPQTLAAWWSILSTLTTSGQRPWLAIDSTDLYKWHLAESVARCCGAVPNDVDGYFNRKYLEFTAQAKRAMEATRIEYSDEPTVRKPIRSSTISTAARGRPWL